jgi:hypothetical protein
MNHPEFIEFLVNKWDKMGQPSTMPRFFGFSIGVTLEESHF